MPRYDYDLIIIGGGSGGLTAAALGAGLGKRVALFEKGRIGGECTHSGCVPSKALIASAKCARGAAVAGSLGVVLRGGERFDPSGVMKRVRSVIAGIYEDERPDRLRSLGIEAFEESPAAFIDPRTVEVNGKRFTARRFIIATGSSPLLPPVPGLAISGFHTNTSIFTIKKIPASLAVMGGGPIGCELAMAFRRLGAETAVIEMAPSIMPREDREMAALLAEMMTAAGIRILTGARVTRVRGRAKISVEFEREGATGEITAEALLVAAGRKPNIDGLGLDHAGIRYTKTGVTADERMRTNLKHVYAVGDVAGPYQFSHLANHQAIAAASNALLPFTRKVAYDMVPWITFTDPELARSGLTEEEARERHGRSVRVYRAPYAALDRARTDGRTEGLAKFICDRKGRLLGVHVLGARAGEVMQEAHLARAFGIPLHRLGGVIHAYPAYAELVRNAARACYIDRIQRNPVVRLVKLFRRKK